MYVQCERCKTEYDFDDALVSERGTTVKCTNCAHQFRVKRASSGGQLDRWVVTTVTGQELIFTSLKELQRAIIAKLVGTPSRGAMRLRACLARSRSSSLFSRTPNREKCRRLRFKRRERPTRENRIRRVHRPFPERMFLRSRRRRNASFVRSRLPRDRASIRCGLTATSQCPRTIQTQRCSKIRRCRRQPTSWVRRHLISMIPAKRKPIRRRRACLRIWCRSPRSLRKIHRNDLRLRRSRRLQRCLTRRHRRVFRMRRRSRRVQLNPQHQRLLLRSSRARSSPSKRHRFRRRRVRFVASLHRSMTRSIHFRFPRRRANSAVGSSLA